LRRVNISVNALLGFLSFAGLVVVAVAWFAPAIFMSRGFAVPNYAVWIWLVASIFLLLVAVRNAALVPSAFGFPMAFRATVALLFVFCLVRFTTVEKIIDPMKTTRPLAVRIDALKVPEIAASDKASKPEYHVYGHYGVKEVNRRDQSQRDTLPNYFLIDSEEVPRYASFIEGMNYDWLENIDVSRDRLMLYQRRISSNAGGK